MDSLTRQPKALVIVGSAPCAMQDIAGVPRVCDFDFMAIGMDALNKCPADILYIATNHFEDIPHIREIMQERHEAVGGNYQYKIISYEPHEGVDIVEPYRPPSGSSAITATFAAVTLGYEKIILCGCPLTGNAPEGNPYEAFRPGWLGNRGAFSDKVRSMSGWTKELFGEPTEEWLLR